MSTAGKTKSLSRVYFDVGGTVFWTRPETLEKSPKLVSAYKDRLRHPHSDGSIDGESEKRPIRLDKDPEGFRHVLGYLRHPAYPFPPEFEYELQYYAVNYDGLFEDIDESGSSDDSEEDFSDSDSVNTDSAESDIDLDDLEDLEALEAELDAVSDDDEEDDKTPAVSDTASTVSKASATTATSTKSRKLTSREKGEMERGRSRERRPPPSSSSKSSVVSKK